MGVYARCRRHSKNSHNLPLAPSAMTTLQPSVTSRPDVAIVVGHSSKSQGAVSVDRTTEFAYNEPIALALVDRLRCRGVQGVVVYRGLPNDYTNLPFKINDTKARIGVELHFNSVANTAVQGAEMLHWHTSPKSRRLASLLLDETIPALGVKSRGLVAIKSTKDRGGCALYYTKMPFVMVEPFFGSNADDWRKAVERKDRLIEGYAEALAKMVAEVRG